MRLNLKSNPEFRTSKFILVQTWKFILTLLLFILSTQMTCVKAEAESVRPSDLQPDGIEDLVGLIGGSLQGQAEERNGGGAIGLEGPKIKKHLGSVAAASGLRRPSSEELGKFNDYGRGQFSFKRGIPPTLRKYFFGQTPFSWTGTTERQRKSEWAPILDEDDEILYKSIEVMENPMSYNQNQHEDQSPFREKRFMGALARGGWFPREFRGYVAGPQWDKRHVGAFARLGWMPHAKQNRQDDQGFKRNRQIWIPKEERTWED